MIRSAERLMLWIALLWYTSFQARLIELTWNIECGQTEFSNEPKSEGPLPAPVVSTGFADVYAQSNPMRMRTRLFNTSNILDKPLLRTNHRGDHMWHEKHTFQKFAQFN